MSKSGNKQPHAAKMAELVFDNAITIKLPSSRSPDKMSEIKTFKLIPERKL